MSLRDELIEAMATVIRDCRNHEVFADQTAPAVLTALSCVLAARGLKITAREATEGMDSAGWIGIDHMTPETLWTAMWDAAPDLLGDGA